MKQISFSQVEFAGKKRTTRRKVFLAEMEEVMPWSEVLGAIEPHYPTGKRGRPPVGLPSSQLSTLAYPVWRS